MNIESELYSLILEVEKYLVAEDVEHLKEYLSHNELGLVVEHLCTQLIEYEVGIPKRLLEKIQNIGLTMEMDKEIWKDIAIINQGF